MPDPARPGGRVTPSFVMAAIQARLRRWQAVRWVAAIAAAAALAGVVNHTRAEAAQAQAQWGTVEPVWLATRSLLAGEILEQGDAVLRGIPKAAIPDDAMRTDPEGLRLRVDVAAMEILRLPRLDPSGGGAVAARLPEREVAITLTVDDNIFAIKDRVDLHALSSGLPLSVDGTVVATSDGKATIAVGRAEMGGIVAELSRGGVAVVLSG